MNTPEKHDRHTLATVEETALPGEPTDRPDMPDDPNDDRFLKPTRIAAIVLVVSLLIALYVGQYTTPRYSLQRTALDVQTRTADNDSDPTTGKIERFYIYKGKPVILTEDDITPIASAQLTPEKIAAAQTADTPLPTTSEIVRSRDTTTNADNYYQVTAIQHFGPWSLLPAFVAITLCLLTREPLTALLSGVIVGAFLLTQYDLTDAVLLESLASKSAAGVLLLYLWLLGGLMGLWSRTGAAQAFAELMTKHFVRGPRSARLVAWLLGVIFFQGGTMSTVLVGTTVKPIADKEKISSEELSYIVDSTASPIASVLAFNAWPGYIQALIYLPGVAFLATESDRLSFFFKSTLFSFYGIFAVLGTFLLCLDKAPFLGKRMRNAITRARTTGQLTAPGSTPLSAPELQASRVPAHYKPHVIDFFAPLIALIAIAITTFIITGSPQIRWAFGAALLIAALLAMARGMTLADLMDGFGNGLKGVVVASVILLLAITIGAISKQTGGGVYLVDLLGDTIPYWLLPVALQILTMLIAFSTGTSWGTYAVAFPLGMPLAWAIASGDASGATSAAASTALAHPEFFMMLCFAAILNGSVYGDQCSPISDTTILSSMTCGADLMDHVKTQLIPATAAATLAAIAWTSLAYFAT